jgi:predicted nucleic acid-binding Zn ribbon protein
MTGPRGEAHLGQLLEGVLANLDLRRRFREHLTVMGWPQIVGRVVAAHSEAEGVRDGVLMVATDTGAWAQELQMRQGELLGLVARQVGAGVIREIHFRSGRRRKRIVEESRSRRVGGTGLSEVKLGGRERKQIAEAAGKIEDEELRERAERALTALARMTQWRRQAGWRQCQRCGRWQRVGRRWCATCSRGGGRRRKR